MARRLLVTCLLGFVIACGSEGSPARPDLEKPVDTDHHHDEEISEPTEPDKGSTTSSGAKGTAALTFWQDMVPIFEAHCMGCHREGGSGPFRLDEYSSAKAHAGAIAAATRARTMPPSYILADGSCGEVAEVNQLSDEQIALIDRWTAGGAKEGTQRAPLVLPEPKTLEGAHEYVTPTYTPTAIGGELAATDDYHCFVFDAGIDAEQFITAFDIAPGAGNIHHVIGYLVDPAAPSLIEGVRNADAITLEDMRTPTVPGWTCLANVGETIAAKALRATWVPGQGATWLPNESGVRIRPTDKVVVQVHYTLKHTDHAATSSMHAPASATGVSTTLRLAFAPSVRNEGFFLTGDGLLDSIALGLPAVLAPGKKSQIFRWTHSMQTLGLPQPRAELWGIYPHMHGLGLRYRASVATFGVGEECIVEVPRWNYHWQSMYLYEKPIAVTPETLLNVACEYDTSSRSAPVTPGMGTDNEMCAAFLYVTVPPR